MHQEDMIYTSKEGRGPFRRRRLGDADSALGNWVPCRFGAGHLGAVSYFIFFSRVMKKKQ